MTKYFKETTEIPNWVMSIILVSVIGVAGLGWTKVDSLEKELIVTKEKITYRTEEIKKIDHKLDEILCRLRELETK